MANTYKLPLTGDQIASRLALLEGDSLSVEIKANKVTASAKTSDSDSELSLVTKSYVDGHLNNHFISDANGTSLKIGGTTISEEQFNKLLTLSNAVNAEEVAF